MLPRKANVVIVGAGALGTSAAFQLTDAGMRDVVLLDRGPIGSGTTPFAAGQTGHLRSDRITLEFTSYCIDFFENFAQRTGHAIDFHQHGSLRIALTEPYQADLEQRAEAAATLGHEARFISVEAARKLVPTLQLERASGILLSPRDGFVEPKSVAVAFASAARDRGALVATNTKVTGLKVADGRVGGVKTTRGTIDSEFVVLAAGAWTRHLGQQIGVHIHAVPVRHQAYVTAPLPGVSDDQPIVRITEPQIYVRQESGGLLVGGYGYRPMSFDMQDFPDDFEIPALPADRIYYDQLAEAAIEFFPVLRGAPLVQERRGLPTMAPDAKTIVSESREIKGLVFASACTVGGVHHSPGIGRIVSDIVTGNPDWLPAGELQADRFDDHLNDDAHLRARCEAEYARMYRGVI